jgi:acyl-[acyl-carrier-protein] desaturase
VTRNIDPIMLERRRMATMELGSPLPQKPALRTRAYAALQELATRICHRNTGRYSGDPVADGIMNRIAIDENLHMIFYRDVVTAALEVDPSRMLEAVAREVISFSMPGIGIQEFAYRARQIARAGIYDLQLHQEEVVWPLLRHWTVFGREGLDAAAEQARLDLAAHLKRIDRLVCRLAEKRSESGGPQPARIASPDHGATPLRRHSRSR